MEGLHPSDLLIHIINILVLFVLLRTILFKPVNKFLSERTARIENQLKDAETKQAEALELKASQEASAIVKDARNQAEELIAEAHEKIAADKVQAVAEARTEVALLATEIAARILKREVSVADNKAVAEDFFRDKG